MPVLRFRRIKLGQIWLGENMPPFIIAEIGINHNGSLEIAKKMIDGAVNAGCHAVKFQKRTPELCVPKDQWFIKRHTPWGEMTYIDYRMRMEFNGEEFTEIDRYCRGKGIIWFASCWDEPSVDFIERFDTPLHKAPSAMLTNLPLLSAMKKTGRPLMLSSGMSTLEEIDAAVEYVSEKNLLLAHSTSSYPCPDPEINLLMVNSLKKRYPEAIIGYSGHDVDTLPSIVAAVLGATFIERHVTLDKTLWGTDQSASLNMDELVLMIQSIHRANLFMGDGIKRIYPSEMKSLMKLRPSQNEFERTQSKRFTLQTWYNQKIKAPGNSSRQSIFSRSWSKAL
ncbi:MAG: N-acetylneuraminate synthase [Calditrichaeota bacterium]|nr:MAG: N-acetylneuraminate synthase [Calditrichota bacterium]